MSYNPNYAGTEPSHQAKPHIRFSRIEVLHLLASVLMLSLAFAFVLNAGNAPLFAVERLNVPAILYAAAFLAVASGFVLHELAHKWVAQRYMHWAEFRGQFQGLLVSLLVAAGTGFLFAAPGAVHIWGRVTPRENGIISIVGPGVNFAIALLAMPIALAGDLGRPIPYMFAVVANVNAILCLFNLLPFGNLDGRKVMQWSMVTYVAFIALAIGLIALLLVSGLMPLGSPP